MEVLKTGDVIGIVSPSHVAVKNDYDIFRKGLENLGLRVKYADNLFHRDELGFTASLEDRVSDFNSMIRDPEVRMVLFGGGLDGKRHDSTGCAGSGGVQGKPDVESVL